MWKNGRTLSGTSWKSAVVAFSSGRSPNLTLTCSQLTPMLLWLSITPFGRPVVPEEYGKNTISFGCLVCGFNAPKSTSKSRIIGIKSIRHIRHFRHFPACPAQRLTIDIGDLCEIDCSIWNGFARCCFDAHNFYITFCVRCCLFGLRIYFWSAENHFRAAGNQLLLDFGWK